MAEWGPLHRHVSKSASDLSGAEKEEAARGDRPRTGPPRAARDEPHFSAAHKAHGFFSTLKSRWCRSKTKERKGKKKSGEFGSGQKDGASTDYAADNSSEHSSSATQSPQHRAVDVDCRLPEKAAESPESGKLRRQPTASAILPADSILPTLPIFSGSAECKRKESCLRQHSFFQLRVHLKRGVDLIARDKGGTSDPYVKFKVGGRLLYKSKTVYRDLNPIWDETFTIPIEDAFVPVHIKVFDYDWGLQDDFMGSAYLDLTKLDLAKSADVSLELLDPGKTEYLGMIYLTVMLLPKTQEDKELYFQRTGRMGEVNRRLKSQIWSSVVTIVLVEGKNLRGTDDDGPANPYVKFRLGNEKYKSKVAFKNQNPTWLEQFDLHLYDDQIQELEVSVWDKDKSRDDFLGRCLIDLSMLEREQTHGLWQNLEPGEGTIHLLLTISGTTASETISDLTTHEDNARERENINRRYAFRNSLHNLRDVGHLTVKVYRATGLAAADLGGKSDPFCVLELVNARLQTQTEYKTLSPSWQKIFTFNVKDINSVLEVTVFDEDRDHKVEFLGKVAVPLLRIRNGEKRWYCLKDKKLRSRAKGNCPMILLEMYVVWNPVRACLRTLNPKEEKYMQGEIKFKRQVFVKNVLRLKAIIMIIIDWGKFIQDCFEWERPAQSVVALLLFMGLCHYFEPYMVPAGLLLAFLRHSVVSWLTAGKCVTEDEEEVFGEEDDEDDDKDKEEKKSLKDRLQAIQEVTQTVQNAIGRIASLGEQIKNTFNFTVPFVSCLAIGLTVSALVVMYLVPLRYLIMGVGVNRFARKLLRPHTIPNNEVLDLLSRVPDDEDLVTYREFRPFPSSDLDKRREQRKKHKSS